MKWLKEILGMDKVVETGMRIVDRIAGTDWTPDQKADFILKHQEATKHQSPARRLLAFVFASFWLILSLCWLISSGVGIYLGMDSGIQFANAVKVFMSEHVTQPMNIIVAFYFVSHIIKK